jgi:cell division protein ZapA (FtsZ GTPase activity inhibitor)
VKEKELVKYNFMVAGKAYPVRARLSEIEDLKQIEQLVNSKIYEFMVKYSKLGRMDILTLGFLAAISEIKETHSQIDQETLLQKLENLEGILDTTR